MFVIQTMEGLSFEREMSNLTRYPVETFTGLMIFFIFCTISVFISLIVSRMFYHSRASFVVIMVTSCVISGVSAFFYAKAMLTIAVV